MSRSAEVKRKTRETEVHVRLALDGAGRAELATGIGFFDHMLEALARHALYDLHVRATGDLHVDQHHTVEDVGIVLGQALSQALGERRGIRRYGNATVPLDDALARVVVDVSGRPYLAYHADPATLRLAERVVLPGVGNFAAAKRRLDETGLGEAITDVAKSGRPLLGICLGLQLFLADSEEAPGVPGLGLLPGRVARFHTELPVPHVGWARVRLTAGGRAHGALAAAFDGDEAFFYHVHSYHPVGVDATGALAEAEYGGPFPA